MGADHGPQQLPALTSVRELGAEAMPRCGSTCSRVRRQPTPLLSPRERIPTPAAFLLQMRRFEGTVEGAMIAFLDPWRADEMVGEGHAPVAAVLLASAN
jgi:hypothetical protein